MEKKDKVYGVALDRDLINEINSIMTKDDKIRDIYLLSNFEMVIKTCNKGDYVIYNEEINKRSPVGVDFKLAHKLINEYQAIESRSTKLLYELASSDNLEEVYVDRYTNNIDKINVEHSIIDKVNTKFKNDEVSRIEVYENLDVKIINHDGGYIIHQRGSLIESDPVSIQSGFIAFTIFHGYFGDDILLMDTLDVNKLWEVMKNNP